VSLGDVFVCPRCGSLYERSAGKCECERRGEPDDTEIGDGADRSRAGTWACAVVAIAASIASGALWLTGGAVWLALAFGCVAHLAVLGGVARAIRRATRTSHRQGLVTGVTSVVLWLLAFPTTTYLAAVVVVAATGLGGAYGGMAEGGAQAGAALLLTLVFAVPGGAVVGAVFVWLVLPAARARV
jgi:hypothetical protein